MVKKVFTQSQSTDYTDYHPQITQMTVNRLLRLFTHNRCNLWTHFLTIFLTFACKGNTVRRLSVCMVQLCPSPAAKEWIN
jgi:hypothetical protein